MLCRFVPGTRATPVGRIDAAGTALHARRQPSKNPETAMETIGKRRWVIAEGYLPPPGAERSRQLSSHETACMLNAGDAPAHVAITIFFADREPAGPYRVTIEPRRTLHLRFNDLSDPEPIPTDTDYASLIESDVPIVVQHTRLDSRRAELALMTTTAYACD